MKYPNKGEVGRVDVEVFLNSASRLLEFDLKRIREAGRLYGKEKEGRDLLIYLLWERGAFTNEEIGEFLGVTYPAVSHIARKVKCQLNKDRDYVKEYYSTKPQIKM